MRLEPGEVCWLVSWVPLHCSREVRGLKERQRKVRKHSRMRERSTMPSATGGESGSSLTYEQPGGWYAPHRARTATSVHTDC